MNKWPAGPAQSKKSTKRVLSFIYLFNCRHSAGNYLFIHGRAVFRHSIFSLFSFFHSAGDRPSSHLFIQQPAAHGNLSFIYSKTGRFSDIHFSYFHFSFVRHAEITHFYSKTSRFPGIQFCHFSFFHFPGLRAGR